MGWLTGNKWIQLVIVLAVLFLLLQFFHIRFEAHLGDGGAGVGVTQTGS